MDAIPGTWLAIGFLGQAAFSSRFLLQWITSERRRTVVVPNAFWWLSVAGGSMLLAYALHRHDPVFALGQGAGLLIYARNLSLLGRRRAGKTDQRSAAPPAGRGA